VGLYPDLVLGSFNLLQYGYCRWKMAVTVGRPNCPRGQTVGGRANNKSFYGSSPLRTSEILSPELPMFYHRESWQTIGAVAKMEWM